MRLQLAEKRCKIIHVAHSVSFKDTTEPFIEKIGQFSCLREADAKQGCCSSYRCGWIAFKAVCVSGTRGPEVHRGDQRWNVNKARQERLASNEQRGRMVPPEAVMAAAWDSCVHKAQYFSFKLNFFQKKSNLIAKYD